MTPSTRKAQIAAYKERPTIAGVFAVICNATGQAWVGQSRHVDTQQNGLWFALRQGSSPYRALQAAWKTHGGEAFRFEILDRLPEDYSDLRRKDELTKRAALWRARLEGEGL
ncbi:GIY-YIG nuclease family protein [Phenylobacterium sp.]|uniref:GIY-YIG nuclease family protein n=1 Tax=Phenylobacterium sp. TaxID=1871053 RepID=UPI00272F70FD|nr:GIY-YIG nuclease family protein [Phenylobacterium sp.]MDP1875304.1 GIY-YIG nuclease family protein [Phenylobacterium sp.]MDP3300087.1 GIY-YIG nuclease family protein [Phenylobacterium sp.]